MTFTVYVDLKTPESYETEQSILALYGVKPKLMQEGVIIAHLRLKVMDIDLAATFPFGYYDADDALTELQDLLNTTTNDDEAEKLNDAIVYINHLLPTTEGLVYIEA